MNFLPLDLAAVLADDALPDALGGPDPSPDGSGTRLTQVLITWRHAVDTAPRPRMDAATTRAAAVSRYPQGVRPLRHCSPPPTRLAVASPRVVGRFVAALLMRGSRSVRG